VTWRIDPKTKRRVAFTLARQFLWLGQPVPRRMRRRDRPVDNEFAPNELLYIRCKAENVDEDLGILKPAAIHFPDQSVNRAKHSRPADVIIPPDDSVLEMILWGVSAIAVSDLPAPTKTEKGPQFSFAVHHDPIELNFSHSEIRVFRDNERHSKGKVNDLIKKHYRNTVAMHSSIVLKPLI
jgi:hypothetical protein